MLPESLSVLVRGWLHGNVLFARGERPALFDTGYHSGVEELVAHFEAFLEKPIESLCDIYLTHVHSDHAGGCAELVERSGARVHAHPRCKRLTDVWDVRGLWLEGTEQEMPRFDITETLQADQELEVGGILWRTLELAGHATGGLGFYAPAHRLLISHDALWERGIGMLRPWVDGPQVIDEHEVGLDRIAELDVELVIPGHGQPFRDLGAALRRARKVIADWRDKPDEMRERQRRSAVAFWLLANPGASRQAFEQMVSKLVPQESALDADALAARTASFLRVLLERHLVREREGRVYPGSAVRGAPGAQ